MPGWDGATSAGVISGLLGESGRDRHAHRTRRERRRPWASPATDATRSSSIPRRSAARLRPGELVRVGVGVRLQPRLQLRVVHQGVERRRRSAPAIAEVDQHAPVVGERFLGMQVGGGDDRLAGAEGVAQRAAGDLVRVEVGRDVDVARQQELDHVVLPQVLVHEGDVVADAQAPRRSRSACCGTPRRGGAAVRDGSGRRSGRARRDASPRPAGIASITYSNPLPGPTRPNVETMCRPSRPELLLQAASALGLDVRHAVLDDRHGGVARRRPRPGCRRPTRP